MEEWISDLSRFLQEGTIQCPFLDKELLHHLKVFESFREEFMRGITACQ